jgi:LPXTG-motif cell wall-anchored protein
MTGTANRLWLLAGVLLVAPAGYLFARRITAPLKRFAEAAETLGPRSARAADDAERSR